jgi:hypothetical protein
MPLALHPRRQAVNLEPLPARRSLKGEAGNLETGTFFSFTSLNVPCILKNSFARAQPLGTSVQSNREKSSEKANIECRTSNIEWPRIEFSHSSFQVASYKIQMIKETEEKDSSNVDKGLVAMFLRMSPDERLLANDNMVRTILELRNAYRQRKTNRIRSERNT